MSWTAARPGTCSRMVQRRKERRGFAREEKRMMSIWHRVRWKKQEGHSRKLSFFYRIEHQRQQQQQQQLLHIKLFGMLSETLSPQKKLQSREWISPFFRQQSAQCSLFWSAIGQDFYESPILWMHAIVHQIRIFTNCLWRISATNQATAHRNCQQKPEAKGLSPTTNPTAKFCAGCIA